MGLISLIGSLLGFIYDVIFGCRHHHQTRPFTLKRQTYKVCLDCGRQIFYSPERMTPLTTRELRRAEATAAGSLTIVPRARKPRAWWAARQTSRMRWLDLPIAS